jgi:hypothetical protein
LEYYKEAMHAANLAVPYRHPRLSAVKLAGNTDALVGFKWDATVEELRVELAKRFAILRDSGMVDLEALPLPENSATAILVTIDFCRATAQARRPSSRRGRASRSRCPRQAQNIGVSDPCLHWIPLPR